MTLEPKLFPGTINTWVKCTANQDQGVLWVEEWLVPCLVLWPSCRHGLC